MIKRLSDDRRVVPKWHSPDVTARRPEGRSVPQARSSHFEFPVANLAQHVDSFRRKRHAIFASDLVSAALPFQAEEAREAAEFLLDSSDASPLAQQIAGRLLVRPDGDQPTLEAASHDADLEIAREHLRLLRHQLGDDPRSPLKWCEAARLYAIRGQKEQARRAMTIALGLAPHDRYVLRSGARLWLHLGDPEHAHHLLTRSPRTASDPWLMAAEIGLADIADRRSRHLRTGRSLLSRLPPLHMTELAASIATVELEAGQERQARRLFETSLLDPNDNALAQAEWASERIRLRGLPEKIEAMPTSFEARALEAAAEGRSSEAIKYAHLWVADEPYSLSAAVFGSYEASKAGDFVNGERFASCGLIANPGDSTLLNNVAFCLAKLDRPEQAAAVMSRLPPSSLSDPTEVALRATQGLIAFRSGDFEKGAALYQEAIRNAEDARTKAIAFVMFATEVLRTDARLGPEVAADASDRVKGTYDREAAAWLTHLDIELGPAAPRLEGEALR